MIEAVNLHKQFRGQRVLQGLNLKLRPSAVTAIMGPSGGGKTTLLKILLGLVQPDSGTILYNQQPLWPTMRSRLLAYLPQHPEASFNPRWKLAQSLQEPFELLRLQPTMGREQHLHSVIKRVGFSPQWLARYPHQLSGGELQRAALARALLGSPQFLLADEPTAMLDPLLSAGVMRMLLALVREQGLGLLLTTHDSGLAAAVADEVLHLQEGRLVSPDHLSLA